MKEKYLKKNNLFAKPNKRILTRIRMNLLQNNQCAKVKDKSKPRFKVYQFERERERVGHVPFEYIG